jgi:hypothetical protein
MPKVLIYKDIWIFIIYPTDMYENRKHIHVGKKDTRELCKIWLEPEVEIAENGELNNKQINEIIEIVVKYKTQLIDQWNKFTKGISINIIKVK